MDDQARTDDLLLAEMLKRADEGRTDTSPDDTIDEETIALFIEGGLSGDQRDQLLRHLDEHPQTRKAVSHMMRLATEEIKATSEEVIPPSATTTQPTSEVRWSQIVLAVAASLLITTGLVYWMSSGPSEAGVYGDALAMLHDGRFDKVRAAIKAARQDGVDSPRLRNLDAQAALGIPAELALAHCGSLTDFGYQIDGVIARAPADEDQVARREEASGLLSAIQEPEDAVRLNRGYLLLEQARVDEALATFRSIAEQNDTQPLAWLGLGMAAFMAGDLEQAEMAFRRAIQLDPDQVDARINLTMTLTEQGKLKEAIAAWQAVPRETLSEDMKQQIAKQIELLSKHAGHE